MKLKLSNFKRVQPKKYDAALMERMCNEGRLYIYIEPEENVYMYRREVLDYVQRINNYVTEAWRERIAPLWQAIVNEPLLEQCLVMKNGMKRGHMNKYVVTNIVCRLQNAGVYSKDASMLELHLKLEGVKKKNNYYKSCSNYELKREDRVLLHDILQRV